MSLSVSLPPEKPDKINKRPNFKIVWVFFWVAILLISICVNLLVIFEKIGQDEVVFLTIAKGLANNQFPYLDFFDHKPPGIYLFLTSFQYLFQDPHYFRILFFLLNLSTAFIIFLTANLIYNPSGYYGAILFLSSLPFFQGNRIIAEPILAFLIALSLYLLISNRRSGSGVIYFLLGFLTPTLFLVKQPGIVNSILIFAFILLVGFNRKYFMIYILGILVTISGLMTWILENGALNQFFCQVFILNFTNYPKENIHIVLYTLTIMIAKTLPVWILGLIGICTSRVLMSQKNYLLILLTFLLPIPFFTVRHYQHYWLQILPALSIFAGIAVAWMTKSNFKFKTEFLALIVLSITINSCIGFATYLQKFQKEYLPAQKEMRKIQQYIDDSQEKNILVENQFTVFYYLTNKEKLSKYLYITEINNDSEQSEANSIERLKNRPDTLILWPKDSNFAYAKSLQNYIYLHYKVERKFDLWGLDIYTLKN